VSICIHRHMDNKIISKVRHDNRGKSILNKGNRYKVRIHLHLEIIVYRNINFDYSKRNKTPKHYLEFSNSMANLFPIVVFPQNKEGISISLPVSTERLIH